jgi:hypothetical protein
MRRLTGDEPATVFQTVHLGLAGTTGQTEVLRRSCLVGSGEDGKRSCVMGSCAPSQADDGGKWGGHLVDGPHEVVRVTRQQLKVERWMSHLATQTGLKCRGPAAARATRINLTIVG